MAIKDFFVKLWSGTPEPIVEAQKPFAKKGQSAISDQAVVQTSGEGYEYTEHPYSSISMSSFNMFYESYLNKAHKTEVDKIEAYRDMAEMPEIADVIEDITIESTQEDFDGKTIHVELVDEEMKKNDNMVQNIEDEFQKLFYENMQFNHIIPDLIRSYFIDGRVFYERLINPNKPSEGIRGIKKLPAESMDFEYDPKTLKITRFFQYLTKQAKRPMPGEVDTPGVVFFHPEQIGFIDYGIYGRNRYDIIGYLDKSKIPYNQLKLLETSVVIYRLVRAPERFVFKIDVGQMPRDKAIKYVEEIKNRVIKRPTYDPETGTLTNSPEIFGILDNFFIPTSSDGRGADVTTIGGNPSGFAELGDINYFQRKLYKSLKYPMSRVTSEQDHQEAAIVMTNSPMGQISRDEIKWATFLERHQTRFCSEFKKLFLLHLEFKGLKKEYELSLDKFTVKLNPPSFYKDKQQQILLESKFNNYMALANQQEFSKVFLMERYLGLDQEEIEANSEGLKEDVKLGFKPAAVTPEATPTADTGATPPADTSKEPSPEDVTSGDTEKQFDKTM